MEEQTRTPFGYFDISRVIRERISTVPLTSQFNQPQDEKYADHFGLSNYRPLFVSKRDTAENEGLAHLISRIFYLGLEYVGHRHYLYVRMDASIYNKWLRVTLTF